MNVKLIDYLPEDYKKSVSVVELQEIFDKETKKVTNTEEDMQQQLHVATATWGLAAWEAVYGLPVDTTKTDATRRAAIMARMGGTDTTRVVTIKEISETFLQGKVAVIEVNEEYRFEIHFLDVLQKGQNVEDLKRVIDEMKPAHLDYAIILKYNTWGDLQEKCKTWKRVKEKTWAERKDERIIPMHDTELAEMKETQMATTPNYHLNLPAYENVADITKIAENFTEIDKILKANEKKSIAKDIGYTDNQKLNATNVQDAIDNVAVKAAKAQKTAEDALQTMDNLFYVIGVPPTQSGSLTYTGSAQSPTWDNYNSEKLTLGGTTSATNAGTYTATFAPKGKYKWSNGTQTPASVSWVIGRAVVAVPSQNGTLRYTGSTQSPSWNNYDSAKLTLGGTASAVNVGTYSATFTPKDNYQWGDGSTSAKSVSWTIGNAALTLPTQNGSLTYTGSGLTPRWNNYDSQKMTLGGTTDAVDAGTYTATFTPKSGYAWGDGSTSAKSVSWTIGRAVVAVPTQSGTLRYTGSAQSPTWDNYNSEKLISGGTTSAFNAGRYAATFTPKSNYKFPDGSTTAKIVYWNIAKAAGGFSLSKTQISVNNVFGERTVTVSRVGDGAIRAIPQHTNIATCTVSGNTITITPKGTSHTTISVTVEEGTNHEAGGTKTIYVTTDLFQPVLENNSWAEIARISATGNSKRIWQIGDEKNIVVNGETLTLVIIGFDHDDLPAGGKAGITFGLKHLMTDLRTMQSKSDASRLDIGFFSSYTYQWLQETVFLGLPADLQKVVKTVNKNTYIEAESTMQTKDVKIFLFSEEETCGEKGYSYETEGRQYPYFATASNRIKSLANGTGRRAYWWERSKSVTHNTYYCAINDNGHWTNSVTRAEMGICFGFCV